MENQDEQFDSAVDLKNIPLQTEDIGFKAEELISCDKCARANPPTRLKCFYCGAMLEISVGQAAHVRPNLRKLENWEKGYNLIFRSDSDSQTNINLAEASAILNFEIESLRKITESKTTLPVARVESEKEAEIVAGKLRENGFDISIVSDEALTADKLPTRLRALDFGNEELIAIYFNADEIVEIRREDLLLIVSGAVFERKTESIEKRKKGESKILDASETASDEILIDVYSRENSLGYRIMAKGFDFSCLGAEKNMTAIENMKKLVVKLREFAPDARFVGDYLAVRELLGYVWENEQRKDSQGLKRHSFGKFDFSNVETTNNLQQFTKYSRLQRQLL